MFNVDGFGLAYYTFASSEYKGVAGPRPTLYKTPQPPLHDLNFRSIAANTRTTALFAHIRAATATPIVSVNNHPFVFGRHSIMHNGVIADFVAIARDLSSLLDDDAYSHISGSTDSEHFAALYITYLTSGRGIASWEESYPVDKMRAAMTKTVETVIELQHKHLGAEKVPANSLNVAVTDGEKMVAIRCRNHAVEQPPSLYYSTKAGVTLNSKYPDHPDGKDNKRAKVTPENHGMHVIVASEPCTYKQEEWELIGKNQWISISKEEGVKLGDLGLSKDLDAKVDIVGN